MEDNPKTGFAQMLVPPRRLVSLPPPISYFLPQLKYAFPGLYIRGIKGVFGGFLKSQKCFARSSLLELISYFFKSNFLEEKVVWFARVFYMLLNSKSTKGCLVIIYILKKKKNICNHH
eukprot:TRINITY_DN31577_c0_g1_i1.p1 TRINITY_DN31577_c0_g1~~TRINITY_DN31577_c0_g1_i1.p1  ORF type:complete len:118 (+),score=7.94 TRINITY_DN31577_c0_g1_i1:265-618(+)